MFVPSLKLRTAYHQCRSQDRIFVEAKTGVAGGKEGCGP